MKSFVTAWMIKRSEILARDVCRTLTGIRSAQDHCVKSILNHVPTDQIESIEFDHKIIDHIIDDLASERYRLHVSYDDFGKIAAYQLRHDDIGLIDIHVF